MWCDGFIGIFNYLYFFVEVESVLCYVEKFLCNVCLVLVDLDYFK